jgi:hypothetical protein
MMMEEPRTPVEAVAFGLYLALTAPTERKSQQAIKTTADIIEMAGLSPQEVDEAKFMAQEKFKKHVPQLKATAWQYHRNSRS